jgi:hypothetical protein
LKNKSAGRNERPARSDREAEDYGQVGSQMLLQLLQMVWGIVHPSLVPPAIFLRSSFVRFRTVSLFSSSFFTFFFMASSRKFVEKKLPGTPADVARSP